MAIPTNLEISAINYNLQPIAMLGTNLEDYEVYVANFYENPPIIQDGAYDVVRERLYT